MPKQAIADSCRIKTERPYKISFNAIFKFSKWLKYRNGWDCILDISYLSSHCDWQAKQWQWSGYFESVGFDSWCPRISEIYLKCRDNAYTGWWYKPILICIFWLTKFSSLFKILKLNISSIKIKTRLFPSPSSAKSHSTKKTEKIQFFDKIFNK